MNCYYIVAAAGIGKRMGLNYPKQFLEYKGKAVFLNIIDKLEENSKVDGIVIVTKEEYIEKVKDLCKDYKKIINIVKGGTERQDSIYEGLKLIEDEDSIVAIQDGVRPFIKDRYIEETYDALSKDKKISGAVVAVKVKDTIKIKDEKGFIIKTPKRSDLIAAQTPQVFRTKEIKEAYEKAFKDNFYGTDDSSLMERLGKKIYYVEGDYSNIKITSPDDLHFLNK